MSPWSRRHCERSGKRPVSRWNSPGRWVVSSTVADRDSDVRYHKTVHFYLMLPTGGDTAQHDPEFDVVEWFPVNDALEAMAYDNEAGVLRRALAVIEQRDQQD